MINQFVDNQGKFFTRHDEFFRVTIHCIVLRMSYYYINGYMKVS